MKRYLLFLFLVLLVSCSTFNAADGTDGVPTEEEKEAVAVLVADMTDELDGAVLTTSDILPALGETYTVYSTYLPSYQDISGRYLSSLISIFSDAVSSALLENIGSSVETLTSSASLFLDGGEVTPVIETLTRTRTVEKVLEDPLLTQKLEEAGEESILNFRKVRKAYSLLGAVDKDIILPEPETADAETVINLILDRYYSFLEEREMKLRSNPFYGESSYRLFWRDRNG